MLLYNSFPSENGAPLEMPGSEKFGRSFRGQSYENHRNAAPVRRHVLSSPLLCADSVGVMETWGGKELYNSGKSQE